MPTQVTYNGKRLIPAPQLSINKVYQKTGDGTNVGTVFDISINGTLVAFMGSPNSSGTFYTGGDYPADESISSDARLHAIQNKIEALRELFANEGLLLEFQSANGAPPMKCNPRINDISFAEGIWFDRVDYTINCQSDDLVVDGNSLGEDTFSEYLESASESWSFDVQNDQRSNLVSPTYTLTHSIQAKGKRHYDETGSLVQEAWKEARDYVVPRLGLDNIFALSSGVNSLPGYYQGYNHIRNQNIDELDGDFGVTETWIISSGDSIEDYTINTNRGAEDGRQQVTIDGNVTGFETKNANGTVTKTKWQAASEKFTAVSGVAYTRAQNFSGINGLNSRVLDFTIGRNPIQGTVSYSFAYDDRPTNLITNSKSESITVGTSWDVDAIASIGILNRSKGPLMQSLGTHQQATRNLSIEVVMGSDYVKAGGQSAANIIGRNPRFVTPQSTEIQAIVNAAHPVTGGVPNNIGVAATVAYVTEQTENWDARTGRYSYQVAWSFE